MKLKAKHLWLGLAIATVSVVIATPGQKLDDTSLTQKVNSEFNLDNATFSQALEKLLHLPELKDVTVAAPEPNADATQVTLHVSPGKYTVKELLQIVAELYQRNLQIDNGTVKLQKGRGWIIEPNGQNKLEIPNWGDTIKRYDLQTPKNWSYTVPDLKSLEPLKAYSWALGGQDNKQIAEELKKIAEEMAKTGQQKALTDKDQAKIKELAERLAKMAKELAEKSTSMVAPFLRSDTGNQFFRQYMNPKNQTPEKREQMNKWLKEHGYQPGTEDGNGLFKYFQLAPRSGDSSIFKLFNRGDTDRAFVFGTQDIKGLMNSLTDKQWELQKKNGYLTPDDLTPKQRVMLGSDTKGDFSLSFSLDGKTLTIKSK